MFCWFCFVLFFKLYFLIEHLAWHVGSLDNRKFKSTGGAGNLDKNANTGQDNGTLLGSPGMQMQPDANSFLWFSQRMK